MKVRESVRLILFIFVPNTELSFSLALSLALVFCCRPTYVFSSGVQSEEVETDDHLGLALYFRQDGMLKVNESYIA